MKLSLYTAAIGSEPGSVGETKCNNVDSADAVALSYYILWVVISPVCFQMQFPYGINQVSYSTTKRYLVLTNPAKNPCPY